MKCLTLLAILVLAYSFCSAQNTEVKQQIEPAQVKIGYPSPYYVFQVGDKSVGIEVREDEKFTLASINPEGIKEIQVLKGDAAIAGYGDKGIHGVVIISFKESYVLPKDLQERFDDSK